MRFAAARPTEGFLQIVGYPEPVGDNHGGTMGKLDAGFNYEADRPDKWADANDIWVHGYWAYDWANSHEHIATIDTQKRLIKTSPLYGNYGFRAGGHGGRFYFLNILEEVDKPQEWYLDRRTGILYFWPSILLEQSTVLVSLVETPLIHLEPPFSTRYQELADLEPYYAGNDGVPPGNIVVANNICVRSQILGNCVFQQKSDVRLWSI